MHHNMQPEKHLWNALYKYPIIIIILMVRKFEDFIEHENISTSIEFSFNISLSPLFHFINGERNSFQNAKSQL
jgi:hypothetical protein